MAPVSSASALAPSLGRGLAVVLASLLAASAVSAQPTPMTPVWAGRVTASSGIGLVSDAAASQGGFYFTGASQPGTHTIVGPTTSLSMDLGFDIALYAGIGSGGDPLWLQPSTDTPFASGYHIAAGAGVVVSGEGPFPDLDLLPWAVGTTALAGRSATTGDTVWTRLVGVPVERYEPQTNAVVQALSVGEDGSTFIAGLFRDTLALGADVLVASPGGDPDPESPFDLTAPYDVFVARLSPDGTPVWGIAIGGEGAEWVTLGPLDDQAAFDVDTQRVYLGGAFPPGSSVRRGAPSGAPMADDLGGASVLVFDHDGGSVRVIEREDLGVSSAAYPFDLDVPPTGGAASGGTGSGIAIAWWFPRGEGASQAVVTVGDRVFRDPNARGVFVSRHEESGTLNWALPVTGGGLETVDGLAVAEDGLTWFIGGFDGSNLSLGGAVLDREGNGDGFVAVVDEAGRVHGYTHITGPRVVRVGAIAVGPGGSAFVAGGFRGRVELGEAALTSSNPGSDMFFSLFEALPPLSTSPPADAPAIDMTVGPNPATRRVVVGVSTASPSRVEVEVFDALGRLVSPAPEVLSTGDGRVEVDVSSLRPAVYVVRATAQASDGRRTADSRAFVVVR